MRRSWVLGVPGQVAVHHAQLPYTGLVQFMTHSRREVEDRPFTSPLSIHVAEVLYASVSSSGYLLRNSVSFLGSFWPHRLLCSILPRTSFLYASSPYFSLNSSSVYPTRGEALKGWCRRRLVTWGPRGSSILGRKRFGVNVGNAGSKLDVVGLTTVFRPICTWTETRLETRVGHCPPGRSIDCHHRRIGRRIAADPGCCRKLVPIYIGKLCWPSLPVD